VAPSFALPPELFGVAPGEVAGPPPESTEIIRGTELAAAAETADEGSEESLDDHSRAAGPRHAHQREVITALQRRMLEERERMGGFGALIR
jgi:hypothetical protein